MITAAGIPPAPAIDLYNTRAFPCLTFVAQIYPPPPHVIKQEKLWVLRLLKLPGQVLTASAVLRLKLFANAPQPLVDTSYAARLRTVRFTWPDWGFWNRKFEAIRQDPLLAGSHEMRLLRRVVRPRSPH